jgi:hypothetical protein
VPRRQASQPFTCYGQGDPLARLDVERFVGAPLLAAKPCGAAGLKAIKQYMFGTTPSASAGIRTLPGLGTSSRAGIEIRDMTNSPSDVRAGLVRLSDGPLHFGDNPVILGMILP